jgi:hypothetical protein
MKSISSVASANRIDASGLDWGGGGVAVVGIETVYMTLEC